MRSNRTHTPPPKIENLGDGTHYYNFNVITTKNENDEDNFDYDQVRCNDPFSIEQTQAVVDASGYSHEVKM